MTSAGIAAPRQRRAARRWPRPDPAARRDRRRGHLNCVVNLSVDKPAVFMEMLRVLARGGRIGISDVVAEDRLSLSDRAERGNWVGCIAGALSQVEYEQGLATAGFEQVSVAFTHQVPDGLHSAIVKAVKPRHSGDG